MKNNNTIGILILLGCLAYAGLLALLIQAGRAQSAETHKMQEVCK